MNVLFLKIFVLSGLIDALLFLKKLLERHTNEEQYIRKVLTLCGGNISAAAKQLNISRQSLQYHMKKLAIQKEEFI
ncbi:helix-turn-helix domain-containing protein [Lysinibacillus xylanilyticus]|uniref:helix-turn-helix domain-containing protein n=1 Tax=Lysinibacillus xylanilyticus TaxID=582475 RepID=UPI003808DDBB